MAYSAVASLKGSRIAECYRVAAAITPTDGLAIGPFEALKVGGAGTVALVPRGTVTPVSITVVAGELLRVEFQGIDATGTTATGLVGLG